MVENHEITFVVQGPIYKRIKSDCGIELTNEALASIRRNFPDSKIILSTWIGQDVKNLEYDLLVLSEDPGSEFKDVEKKVLHNVNRQIVSTISGLKEVKTKYAVKVRTDLIFKSDNLKKYLLKYPLNLTNKYCFLKSRLVVLNRTSVNPNKWQKIPYCICDWLYAGETIDLLDFFRIPAFNDLQWTRYFEFRDIPNDFIGLSISLAKYAPEDYIFSSWIKKYFPIDYEYTGHNLKNNLEISESIIANNLLIVDENRIGIESLKYPLSLVNISHVYSFSDWKSIHYKYCLNNEKFVFWDKNKLRTKLVLVFLKFKSITIKSYTAIFK
jgi:hypothetical protein